VDKIIRAFPGISEYVVFLNIWCAKIDINTYTGEIFYDETLREQYNDLFFNFYGLKRHHSSETIDSLLEKNVSVFLNCDNYYLPYHHFYLKEHTRIEHLILIEYKNKDGSYRVFDDVPEFEGNLSEEIILDLHSKAGHMSFWHEINNERVGNKLEEFKHLTENIITAPITHKEFFDKLLGIDMDDIGKLNIIYSLRNYSFLYNGLYRIVSKLAKDFNIDIVNYYCNVLEAYITKWLLIINLANKAILINKAAFIDRILPRINELVESEQEVNDLIYNLKTTVLPNIANQFLNNYE